MHEGVKRDVMELLTLMRRIQPDLIINNRGIDIYGDYSTPENQIPENADTGHWETNMTMTSP